VRPGDGRVVVVCGCGRAEAGLDWVSLGVSRVQARGGSIPRWPIVPRGRSSLGRGTVPTGGGRRSRERVRDNGSVGWVWRRGSSAVGWEGRIYSDDSGGRNNRGNDGDVGTRAAWRGGWDCAIRTNSRGQTRKRWDRCSAR
jgi:hypothetical protein